MLIYVLLLICATQKDYTMSLINKNCLKCQKEFKARSQDVNRGFAKFCSQSCSSIYNRAQKKLDNNAICALCRQEFHMSPSKKENSKSGFNFCCRAHKDEAQKIGGIKEIMPAHYGTAKADSNAHYRRIAFSTREKVCERCGFDNPAAIIVHHKDRDRMNDNSGNLEVLCANCHAIEHLGENGLLEDKINIFKQIIN